MSESVFQPSAPVESVAPAFEADPFDELPLRRPASFPGYEAFIVVVTTLATISCYVAAAFAFEAALQARAGREFYAVGVALLGLTPLVLMLARGRIARWITTPLVCFGSMGTLIGSVVRFGPALRTSAAESELLMIGFTAIAVLASLFTVGFNDAPNPKPAAPQPDATDGQPADLTAGAIGAESAS